MTMAGKLERLKPMAFILGTPRSGTTLLRVMLAGHPALFSPPEMLLAPFETMAERGAHLKERFWETGGLRLALMKLKGIDVEDADALVRSLGTWTIPEVYAHLQELIGDRLLVDKCPHLCGSPRALERLARWFPEARYLWIVRHPGAVIRSIEHQPMAELIIRSYAGDIRKLWHRGNSRIKGHLESVPTSRWTLIRFEELLENPRAVMERACRALGVTFDEALLTPYEGDRMREGHRGARAVGDPGMAAHGRIDPSRATHRLEGFDPRSVSRDTHQLASDLGYDLNAMALPPLARVSDAMGALWDSARELESSIRARHTSDALSGRRFLLRLQSACIERCLRSDPVRPAFRRDRGLLPLAECDDVTSLRTRLRLGQGQVFRVRGQVHEDAASISVQLRDLDGRVLGQLRDEALDITSDGRFEVLIASREQDGLCLYAEIGEVNEINEIEIVVRWYSTDHVLTSPTVEIERVGPAPATAPRDAEVLLDEIDRSRRMIRTIFNRTVESSRLWSMIAQGRFVEVPGERLLTSSDLRFQVASFHLPLGAHALIRGRLPKARYFGLGLYNAWLEHPFACGPVWLSGPGFAAKPDSAFEVCLARDDPGHASWLDASGMDQGFVIARTVLARGALPKMTLEVLTT